MHERQPLDIIIRNKKDNELSLTVIPDRLEYSERDDKFRLLTSGSRTASVINLGRITECSLHEGEFKAETSKSHIGEKRTLTLKQKYLSVYYHSGLLFVLPHRTDLSG